VSARRWLFGAFSRGIKRASCRQQQEDHYISKKEIFANSTTPGLTMNAPESVTAIVERTPQARMM